MLPFRLLLITVFATTLVYTLIVSGTYGWNFFPTVLANVQALNWSGQFNIDFACYLVLSAIWVAWRNRFSAQGMVFALLALVGGILFFAPYLLLLSINTNGNMKKLLLGEQLVDN
jgi:hypothetical protein